MQKFITLLQPKKILYLGTVIIQSLHHNPIAITKDHGKYYQFESEEFSCPIMHSYSLRAMVQNYSFKQQLWFDLLRLMYGQETE